MCFSARAVAGILVGRGLLAPFAALQKPGRTAFGRRHEAFLSTEDFVIEAGRARLFPGLQLVLDGDVDVCFMGGR